jgi:hypothetical protein
MRTARSLLVVGLLLAVAACGSSGSGTGSGSTPGGPDTTPSTTPTTTPVEDLTLTPSPSVPPVTVTGTVSDGVEAGCLVLTTDDGTYTLIGQTRGLTAGSQVTLRGVPAPDVLTTCQQGTAFRVLEVL